jgi:hypothetical protein
MRSIIWGQRILAVACACDLAMIVGNGVPTSWQSSRVALWFWALVIHLALVVGAIRYGRARARRL